MKKYFVFGMVLILANSCAWFQSQPKTAPETQKPSPEEMMRAERDRELAEAENYVGDGIAYYQQGKDTLAIKSWDKALRIIPDDAELHNFKGMALYRTGDITAALKEFQTALGLNPAYYQAYNNAGYMYFLLNNYDRADKAFDSALKYKPDFKDALNNKALLKKVIAGDLAKKVFELSENASTIDDYEQQIRQYLKVLDMDSTYAKAHNNLGVAYYYTGNLDSALIHLRAAVHFKKDYPEAINNLGYLYKVAEKYELAIKLFLKALTLKPRYVGALTNLAETYYLNGELQNARRTLHTVLEMEPGNAVAKRWLVKVETKEAEPE